MTFNPLEYKGNAIFRNQPNHTYFDKSFGDDPDPLYFFLNDIDPRFLEPAEKAKPLITASVTVIDPRTKKSTTHLEYDHTIEEKCKLFKSPKCSVLTGRQHEMCVLALNSLQHGQSTEEEQLYNWYSTQNAREKEKKNFQAFVAEYCQTNRNNMYVPCRKLLNLYQNWYKSRSRKLMERYAQESYNTHLGMPHVRLCTNALKEMQGEICNPEIIANLGDPSRWQTDSRQELKKLNQRLESYLEVYTHSEDKKDELENEMRSIFLKKLDEEMRSLFPKKLDEEEPSENALLYIPLESLLFLLTAGDYIDIPMEMLLNIKYISNDHNDNQKVIIMDLPLPSRQAGWHSYQLVVEEATAAVLSINDIKQNNEIKEHRTEKMQDIYKAFTLEEYMANCKSLPDALCKFSKTLVKWQLKLTQDDVNFNIYTTVAITAVKDKDADDLFSVKLEYKPHLGCEVMTKYQLLKEWIQLKLLPNRKTTCFRLDINNYQTLLQETLTVQKLEDRLYSIYHIDCQQLLANFFEFLKMLSNIPCDHYMLRFNPKFKDKLMLCKPSREITQNTIHLHQILDNDVSDISFMSQQNFLPIDDSLCSLMHLQHKIIPCAFSPHAVVVTKRAQCGKSNKKL